MSIYRAVAPDSFKKEFHIQTDPARVMIKVVFCPDAASVESTRMQHERLEDVVFGLPKVFDILTIRASSVAAAPQESGKEGKSEGEYLLVVMRDYPYPAHKLVKDFVESQTPSAAQREAFALALSRSATCEMRQSRGRIAGGPQSTARWFSGSSDPCDAVLLDGRSTLPPPRDATDEGYQRDILKDWRGVAQRLYRYFAGQFRLKKKHKSGGRTNTITKTETKIGPTFTSSPSSKLELDEMVSECRSLGASPMFLKLLQLLYQEDGDMDMALLQTFLPDGVVTALVVDYAVERKVNPQYVFQLYCRAVHLAAQAKKSVELAGFRFLSVLDPLEYVYEVEVSEQVGPLSLQLALGDQVERQRQKSQQLEGKLEHATESLYKTGFGTFSLQLFPTSRIKPRIPRHRPKFPPEVLYSGEINTAKIDCAESCVCFAVFSREYTHCLRWYLTKNNADKSKYKDFFMEHLDYPEACRLVLLVTETFQRLELQANKGKAAEYPRWRWNRLRSPAHPGIYNVILNDEGTKCFIGSRHHLPPYGSERSPEEGKVRSGEWITETEMDKVYDSSKTPSWYLGMVLLNLLHWDLWTWKKLTGATGTNERVYKLLKHTLVEIQSRFTLQQVRRALTLMVHVPGFLQSTDMSLENTLLATRGKEILQSYREALVKSKSTLLTPREREGEGGEIVKEVKLTSHWSNSLLCLSPDATVILARGMGYVGRLVYRYCDNDCCLVDSKVRAEKIEQGLAWSFGCVLYHLVTGLEPCFVGEKIATNLATHLQDEMKVWEKPLSLMLNLTLAERPTFDVIERWLCEICKSKT